MYMGNIARAPFLAEEVSDREPSIVWSTGVGTGIQGMPVVTEQAIIAATSDRYIEVLSREDGSTFWRRRLEGPPVSPLVIGNVIYTATQGEGRLRSLDIEIGDELWKQKLPSVRVPISISGDTLYAATENGTVVAFDECPRSSGPGACYSRRGEPIWHTGLTQPPSAGPIVVDDALVITTFDSIFVLDRFSGTRRTATHSGEVLIGEVASDGEMLYVASERGSLLAWRVADLELVWQTSGFGGFLAGPVLADTFGYAVSRTGALVRFRTADGEAGIIAECRGPVVAPPTLVRNGILIGTMEGWLHFLTRDGEPVWEKQLDGSIEAPVAVHESRILVTMYGKVSRPLGSPYRGKVVELR
jgi:outer membrane protein assembly factor BamB